MNNANGFIKLHRKMLSWGWYQDSVVKDVFIHLLLTANFRPREWMGFQIEEGQLVIGTQKLADELGLTRQQVRTALNKLKSTNEITIKPTNRFSIITIVKWRDFQSEKVWSNQQINQHFNQQITNKQPTDNQQITNNQPQLNNYNNIDNIREVEETARARKGDIKDGKIFVDEVNGWVPLEVPEEIREHYDSYLILGLIDEHGNYIYNKDEDED